MLIVACREMTSGDRGVRSATLSLDKSCKVAGQPLLAYCTHVRMLHTSPLLHRLTVKCCL